MLTFKQGKITFFGGGQFGPALPGQFAPAEGGQFSPAGPGQFTPARTDFFGRFFHLSSVHRFFLYKYT